jgi:hypothetical protein
LNPIENDPSISCKFLSEQFDKLLLQPLLKLYLYQSTAAVIVIDALDECDREDDIQGMSELPIRLGFKKNNNHQGLVLHELSHFSL